MVGKIKHVRLKLHQAAAKLDRPGNVTAPTEEPPVPGLNTTTALQDNTSSKQILANSFPTGIFAGTKITPEALVQSLKYEETPTAHIPSKKGSEIKTLKSKKEKMKERRQLWLNKMSSIKHTKEQEIAKARRQATPVVGDLRPLVDALPELCQLIGPPTTISPAVHHKRMKNRVPAKKPEPTDFSQMNKSQKRKLLEMESSWFSDAVKTVSTKKNALADICEQLRKRMRQEDD